MAAFNAQGAKLRRGTTDATGSTTIASTAICVDSTARTIRTTDAAVDFVAGGFTTDMRVNVTGSTLNTAWYTVSCVVATAIGIHELCTSMSSANSSSITVTGKSFAEVGNVKNISVSMSGGMVDITHLGSTAKEYIPSLSQEGPVDFSVWLLPGTDATSTASQHTKLRADRAARALQTFHVMLSDNSAVISSACYPTNCQFDAYVSNFSISAAVDQALSADLSLIVTSAIHWSNKTS